MSYRSVKFVDKFQGKYCKFPEKFGQNLVSDDADMRGEILKDPIFDLLLSLLSNDPDYSFTDLVSMLLANLSQELKFSQIKNMD